jgi:hypothetical protein
MDDDEGCQQRFQRKNRQEEIGKNGNGLLGKFFYV